MRHRLANIREYLSNSLWFVPAMLSIGAILLVVAALRIRIGSFGDGGAPWWLHSGSARDAGNLLATLLSALITMTTLVISITMVVLTLAANVLGPRLIRSFMGDRRTQFVLGMFVGTIVYLLLVLRMIHEGLADEAVPHVAVTIGSALALLCVFVLLFFVHHLARTIIADSVIQRVGLDLDESIRSLLPDAGASVQAISPPVRTPGDAACFRLPSGGYIRAIDYDRLRECARDAGALIELSIRPGHHILPGGASIAVSPAGALGPELEARIAEAILVGPEPTPTQDPEFSIRQLVELALRALSPGINDPYTAIAVIDRLAISLAHAMGRGPMPGEFADDDGTLRVIAPALTFDGMVDVAFNQIRQAGADRPDVLARLLEAFAALCAKASSPAHRGPLFAHAGMAIAAGRRTVEEERDRAALESRYAAFIAAAGQAVMPERNTA